MKKHRSRHFLISDLESSYPEDGASTEVLTDFAAGADFAAGGFVAGNHLQFAVPKKLLKRAVDRNAVRRVARESWRACFKQVKVSERYMSRHHQIRIRLTSRPSGFKTMSRPARKRFWRIELDQLIPKVVR